MAGINDAMIASGNAARITGACPYCSSAFQAVMHGGACPKVNAIEYHQNGTVKRVEFKDRA